MTRGLRTLTTLVVLVVVLAVGVAWGYQQLTRPFPGLSGTNAACEETPIAKGERVAPMQVTVSVVNASDRSGLAGRVRQQFVDAGFGAGGLDNAPSGTKVTRPTIWTDDPMSPAVRLVKTRIKGKVPVQNKNINLPGIVVVVRAPLPDLRAGLASIKARAATVVCVPPPTAPTPDPAVP